MNNGTKYVNTDFDLKSKTPCDRLYLEFNQKCCVRRYASNDERDWHLILELAESESLDNRKVERDILSIMAVLTPLSPVASIAGTLGRTRTSFLPMLSKLWQMSIALFRSRFIQCEIAMGHLGTNPSRQYLKPG